jgi:uncharacterized protein (TIGR03083 family)
MSNERASTGTLEFGRTLEVIAAESHRLAEVVAGADLDERVPSCPEWSVRDLAHHIGVVQWYWSANVAAADAQERSGGELTALPDDTDLPAWLGWCTYELLHALRDAGPDSPCWAWWPTPHTAGAVARHQAQEAAVHRWDAEGVGGLPSPLLTDLAEDGVPEFVEIMIGESAGALRRAITLTATDTGASWQVGGGDTGPELHAPASDLVLMLYRRLPVPDDAVVGDPMAVAALLSLADTS